MERRSSGIAPYSYSLLKNHKAEGGTPSAYYGRKIDEKSFLSLASIKIPDGC